MAKLCCVRLGMPSPATFGEHGKEETRRLCHLEGSSLSSREPLSVCARRPVRTYFLRTNGRSGVFRISEGSERWNSQR